MTQEKIDVFSNQIYSKPAKKNYSTKKTDVCHFDNNWSLVILDLKDYGPEKKRGFLYVLVVFKNFSKIGWTLPFTNKTPQTIKESFKNFFLNSKRKRKLFESDREKEFYISIFQNFLKYKNIKIYSRNTSTGVVFAGLFYRTIRDLLKRPVVKTKMVIG